MSSSPSETEEPSGHKNTATEDDTSMLTQHSEYVTELLGERARLGKPEQPFKHLPRLIEAEINRFLGSMTTESSRTEKLPKRIMLQEKLIVPVDKYPKYNFEPLNVIVQCEDYEDVCRKKLEYAIDKVNVLLNPPPEGKDELKRKQLIDLSIINGTYRPTVATKPHSGSHNPLWEEFLNQQCFLSSSYAGVRDRARPYTDLMGHSHVPLLVRNFRWIPYCLIVQLMLFAVPKFAWTTFGLSADGVNKVVSIISQTRCLKDLTGEERSRETPATMAMASAALRNSQVRISSPSDQLFEYFVNTALMPDGCIALWFIQRAIWDQSVSRIKKNTKPILRVQGSLDYLGGPGRESITEGRDEPMDFEEPLPQTSDFEKDRLLDVAEYDTLRTRLAAVENDARQLRAGLAIRRAMESCASNRMSEKRSFHNDAGFPLRCRVETEHLHDERIHFKPAARAPVELRIEAQRLFPTNVYGKRSVLRIPLDLRLVTLWNLGTNAELDEERKRPAGLTSPLNCSSVPIPGQLAYLLCGRLRDVDAGRYHQIHRLDARPCHR
ncbi:unnamed protein product, partial [Mesorhabditis spiculigera]